MAAPKLPPQIRSVRQGMMLKFIRPVFVRDGDYYLNKGVGDSGREVYVLEGVHNTDSTLCLVAFKTPLRNTMRQPIAMLEQDGFKYCRWVDKHLLINNCREI